MSDYGQIGRGIGAMVKFLIYFLGAFFGAVGALIVAIWVPVDLWVVVPIVAGAIGARGAFFLLVRE